MKKLITLLCAATLVIAPIVLVGCSGGCKSSERTQHTTLHATGKAVDIAEREYMDGIVKGTIRTNEFPQIQAGYKAFQASYRLAVQSASGDTNALTPTNLSALAAELLQQIQIATKKGKN